MASSQRPAGASADAAGPGRNVPRDDNPGAENPRSQEGGTSDALNGRTAPAGHDRQGADEGDGWSNRVDQRPVPSQDASRDGSARRPPSRDRAATGEPTDRTKNHKPDIGSAPTARADAPEPVDGAPLTKRKRRRRRKSAKNAAASAEPAVRSAAPEQESAQAPAGDNARPRGARKQRRRRSRRFAAAGEQAAPVVAESGSSQLRADAASPPAAADRQAHASPSADAPAPVRRAPVYAALDLGTNNCRLLIAIPTRPGQFRVIDAFSRIVRLGEGLSRTGSLSRGAMDRAIAALSICAQKLSARDVVRCRLIATEACRAAANGAEFIEEVARETGLELEIVTRETEARLAVSGCGSLIERSARGAVLFDIGGGSSEIALLDLRGRDTRRLSKQIVAWTSLPVGVVTLAERHGGRDVTPEIFETMISETVEMIHGFAGRDKLGSLVGTDRFHLLGTSGTVTTLAGVHLKLERYDRRQVDGLWLTDLEADELVARIAGWSFEERIANPCIGSDRADLVLAGCAILQAIRRVWPAPTLRVADRGLREGLLMEMMVADGVWRRRDTTRNNAT
ncbi:Ppx/GppA family phosphatase [Aurantimonas sp. A2-1-M11]|uniref:Ppx/GppA phosphatase family protein n=1 Tax=Aurantimonas sp. A2-1-M11 TaxID=3113712 RepID=UPI002F942C7F